MELLNEIRPSNQITLVNLLHFWNRWECKRDKTVEFVTWLNILNCWMRYECEIRLYYWICDTIECVGMLNKIRLMNLLHLWNRWECKRDKTVEFVTLLNMWECWMRYECEIR